MIRFLLAALLFASASLHAADKPNIIYILTDDLGIGDLGCYGQKMLATPNIDRMAAEGMKFTRHYAGCTVCAPSRCVLMTGLHTGHCRVRGNGDASIPDTDATLPKMLKAAGYYTIGIGKYGLGKPLPIDDPQKKGFDYFYGYVETSHAHNLYPPFLVKNGEMIELKNDQIPGSGKESIPGTGVATADGRHAWAPGLLGIEARKLTDKFARQGKPFFLYYALNLPHANNEAKADSPLGHGMESPGYGRYQDKDWPPAEKGFAEIMRFIDREVGSLLTTLQDSGSEKNTLVIFSSDNGAHQEGGHKAEFFDSNGSFNGIKRDLTDGGIRVPMIAWWLGKIKAGSTSDHVSAFQDIMPTLAELCGATLAAPTDGISMLPTLLGTGEQKKHDYLFWNFDEQGGKRAVLQWPWKLIHLNTMAKGGKPLEVQLFNLDSDPEEKTNVAAQNADLVQKLEGKMRDGWREP
jgi:arylsulfatase A-like enzyme